MTVAQGACALSVGLHLRNGEILRAVAALRCAVGFHEFEGVAPEDQVSLRIGQTDSRCPAASVCTS